MAPLVVLLALCLLSTPTHGRSEEDARIVAARSTKTAISFTTSTTVTPYTCALVINAKVCQRRRYKRYSSVNNWGLENDYEELHGSVPELSSSGGREGRIALTIWSTTTSVYTVTTTSINSSTTFSVSFYCTVNGASFPPLCG
ncbi:uncharacterized protein [Procambarus clarkii]|nr:uncharacterized protein LOC123762891 isoform X2 [Procambarus clarkii]